MANPKPEKLVRTSEVVIISTGPDKYDVVERTIEGRVAAEKKLDTSVSLPVARHTWTTAKAKRHLTEGWK